MRFTEQQKFVMLFFMTLILVDGLIFQDSFCEET